MFGRARRRAVLGGGLRAAIGPVAPARAVADNGGGSRSAPTQDGWWNRLQGPADGEPDGNPARPLVPPVPGPPTVPADAIAAGAGAGQVDKVAAIGIDLALADGATVGGLTLRLRESPAGGASVGADRAKVTACPATAAWGPNRNAAWRDRPAADCSRGSVQGVRAADGTWTFDLTAIGRLWKAAVAPMAGNGVVLAVDPAGSPSPVQVSWLDVETGHVAVDLTAAAPPAPPSAPPPSAEASAVAAPPPLAAPAAPISGAIAPSLVSGPGGLEASSGEAAGGAGEAAGGGDASAVPPTGTDVAAAVPAGQAAPPAGGAALRDRPAVGFWGHVPRPAGLLVPIAAGLAGLVGLVLGPMGRPSPVFRREGGLSRALARRAA